MLILPWISYPWTLILTSTFFCPHPFFVSEIHKYKFHLFGQNTISSFILRLKLKIPLFFGRSFRFFSVCFWCFSGIIPEKRPENTEKQKQKQNLLSFRVCCLICRRDAYVSCKHLYFCFLFIPKKREKKINIFV